MSRPIDEYTEAENRNTANWDSWCTSTTLDPDDGISAKAERVFTTGHCHSLALALVAIVDGAIIVGEGPGANEPPSHWCDRMRDAGNDEAVADAYAEDSPDHVLVRLPDGSHLDAHGRWHRKDPDALVEGVPPGEDWHRWSYKTPREDDAAPFALALLLDHAPEYV